MSRQRDRQVPDGPIARRARELFDDSVEQLDAATLSQLNRKRHAALQRARGSGLAIGWPTLVPAAGFAAAAVVVGVLLFQADPFNASPNGLQPLRSEAATDFEILLEGDDLEMLEDLEFYSWIDLETETASHVG